MYANYNRFMTPLYASPNITQKAQRVNYFLEDVFSLGVSFLQMAGLFTSDELSSFHLNQRDFLYDTKSTANIDAALDKCLTPLSHFHKQLLRRMLAFEAEDRPHFIELQDIMRSPQLALNLDNISFVDGVFKEKVRECGNQLIGVQKKLENRLTTNRG